MGISAATALPPWYFHLGIFGFTIFLFLLNKCSKALEAASFTWLFAFGFHLFGLHWVSNALLVDSENFRWLIPVAFLGLPAALAIIPAVLMSAMPLITQSPLCKALAATALWTLAEYFRGHILTGFPWNLPVYIFSFSEELIQSASVLGAYGLSFLVVLFTTGPFLLFSLKSKKRVWDILITSLVCLIPIILWIAGNIRLDNHQHPTKQGSLVRIVQGNISQNEKWLPELREKHIQKYISLSNLMGNDIASDTSKKSPSVIIWPETAVPALLSKDQEIRRLISRFLKNGTLLITGAPSLTKTTPPQLRNSIFVLNHEGEIVDRYDKARLVPFGEYLPFKDWLPFSKIVSGFSDFQPGPGVRSLSISNIGLMSPLICYEIIFPGRVVSGIKTDRPNLLLNITNDAWFGKSAGPYQHLEHARLRAIEEGIPLIRVANTGISGFYDALGREMGVIELGKTGFLERHLTQQVSPNTFYGHFGDSIYIVLTIILLMCLLVTRLFYQRSLNKAS